MIASFKTRLMGCALIAATALPALAQETATDDETSVQETVTVTGSRGQPRSVSDSPVPIDVLPEEELTSVPFTDANDVLKTLVPSYSLSRQPISDGATFIRPASLRGMPTDKTLVLVNSKRRHRASLVAIGGSGTQGPDIATIPVIALKSVEVLRDGAAAQYGSDAIAGVINFILKDNSEGGTATAEFGQYYEGDGTQQTYAGNIGFALPNDGFMSISAEISDADATVRAAPYCESWACTDVNDPRFPGGNQTLAGYDIDSYTAGLPDANILDGDVVQPWGQPENEAFRAFFNAGLPIGDSLEAYAFGNYSESEASGNFFYRYPGNGTIEDLRLEDGSVWSPLFFFPGGFTPAFSGEVIDYSIVGGLKGETDTGFFYDVSGRFGHSEIQYTLANTINPSLGPNSPTTFQPGDLVNEEIQFQGDFVQEIEMGLASPLAVAFGVSYMDESYEIKEGEELSYVAGPFATQDPFGFCSGGLPTSAGATVIANGSSLDCADPDDPVYQVVGVGSNGFPGYSPQFSDIYERDSFGVYTDLSADVTERLFLQGAIRYENYSDFDAEVVGKVAGRFEINPNFALRSSVGTGFRAPTPGQQGTTNVSTRLPNGFPVATGLFPAGGPVAQALGAQPLEPETSTNFTAGLTSNFNGMSLTVDFYHIKLEDRINAISTQDVSTDPGSGEAYENFLALQEAGVSGANSIGGVFYFQNAFDTTTQGVDFVATYDLNWDNGSTTSLTGSLNYNKTEIDEVKIAGLFNAEDTFDFENGDPEWRGVFSAVHETGPLRLLARANYYGPYENSDSGGASGLIQDFGAEVLIDLEASYQFTDMFRGTIGARNAFDEYPDAADPAIGDSCCGRIYRSDSVVSWQGGYYYAKLTAEF